MAKTSAKVSVPAPAPVVATSVDDTIKKPSTKKAVPKNKKESVVPVVVAAVADGGDNGVSSDLVAVDAHEVMELQIAEQSLEFIGKLQQLGTIISSLKSEFRVLEKKWSRELKAVQKLNSKKKRKVGNRAPSGFVKPTKISEELSNFLDKPIGCEMARTEVTREINKYIRSNNLQDKTNGRKIIPDEKLSALLKLNSEDELTYFNLQRYMSPHFEKSVKAVAAAAAALAE